MIEIKDRWSGKALRTVDADSLIGADLIGADLIGADLTRANLRRADLRRAALTGADLTGADLTRASLIGANLTGADLTGADLTDADRIPVVERLHARTLEALAAGGVLDMVAWHACETTHCRAGWAIHLAGAEGYALEKRVGAAVAGALIAVASCPALKGKVPNFYASNADAIADIKRLAALEAA